MVILSTIKSTIHKRKIRFKKRPTLHTHFECMTAGMFVGPFVAVLGHVCRLTGWCSCWCWPIHCCMALVLVLGLVLVCSLHLLALWWCRCWPVCHPAHIRLFIIPWMLARLLSCSCCPIHHLLVLTHSSFCCLIHHLLVLAHLSFCSCLLTRCLVRAGLVIVLLVLACSSSCSCCPIHHSARASLVILLVLAHSSSCWYWPIHRPAHAGSLIVLLVHLASCWCWPICHPTGCPAGVGLFVILLVLSHLLLCWCWPICCHVGVGPFIVSTNVWWHYLHSKYILSS